MRKKDDSLFEVIVVGGGHAGCEAALSAARMGSRTLVITMSKDTIGLMSCNPAIGGIGKGQLVKEIDALGGQMGKAADATGIQFRTLNMRKGPAVRSSRAQVDRLQYKLYMRKILERQHNLYIIEGMVEDILVKSDTVYGVRLRDGRIFFGTSVVITPGTFMNGVIHIGLRHFPGGRIGEPPSFLTISLMRLGFSVGRLKTGTTPRLDGCTIDFSNLKVQLGDNPPKPFSFSTQKISHKQVCCYLTYTNPTTHKVIMDNIHRSPLYTGKIKATGVRYCPSIEDKVMRFSQRDSHQVFLEPEGLHTSEYYPNGISTSLPMDVQERIVRSIKGLRHTRILRPGYGIEYDYVHPTQLRATLETKLIRNLFLAGQINGTTGYEEAAAQGLIAGINAALRARSEGEFILQRCDSYIGTLIDDLITKGTDEPYRMFTSRAEYRLILREDNADLRLAQYGYNLGLVDRDSFQRVCRKKEAIDAEIARLKVHRLDKILRRPGVSYRQLCIQNGLKPIESQDVIEQVEIEIKYEGFIERQRRDIERFRKIEQIKIPKDLDFMKIRELSNEVREKLNRFRPESLGEASRISGVTPVAISFLMVYLKSEERFKFDGHRRE